MKFANETMKSLAYRVGAIILSFVSVSILVRKLGPEKYGIWATLVSVLVWIQMSDLGIGFVVKNRVATQENRDLLLRIISIAVYLSTTLGLVMTLCFFIGSTGIEFFDQHKFESTILYISAFMTLPSMIGVNILQGIGLSSVWYRAAFAQAFSWFLMVLFIGEFSSLLSLSIGFSILLLANSAYNFHRGCRAIGIMNRQTLQLDFNRELPADTIQILRVGGIFFVLQVTSLILFNFGTWLAYYYFSATAAAKYDVLNKIFQIPMAIFSVFITINWALIAKGLAMRDQRKLIDLQSQLLMVSVVGGMLLSVSAFNLVPVFVSFYTDQKLTVNRTESLSFAVLVWVQMLAYSGAVFLNAAELLKIQLYFAILGATVFLPVFHLLQSAGLGIEGIPISTTLTLLPSALIFNWYVRFRMIKPLAATV